MRTSLIETTQIEAWLGGQTNTEERLVMEARLQTNPELREKVKWQKTTYDLIYLHGRRKLKDEITAIERELFQHTRFRKFQQKIFSIFNS